MTRVKRRGGVISQHYWFIRSKNFWNIPAENDGWWPLLCCLHPIICQDLMNIWTLAILKMINLIWTKWCSSWSWSATSSILDDAPDWQSAFHVSISTRNPRCKWQVVGLDNYIITQSMVSTPYFMSLSWGWIRNRYIWPLFIFLRLVIKVVVKSIRCSIKMFCQVGTNFYDHREFYTIFIWDSSSSGFLGDGFNTSASDNCLHEENKIYKTRGLKGAKNMSVSSKALVQIII